MISKFFILLNLFFSYLTPLEVERTPVAVKFIAWVDVRINRKFVGGEQLYKARGLSLRQCALRCGKINKCRSFNYCSTRFCELNAEDVFSGVNYLSFLLGNPECAYHGMEKNSQPNCKERDSFKNIQIDVYPGYCKINKKRVDREWGDWQTEKVVDSSEELKEVEKREPLLDFAHGGIEGSNEAERIITWLRLFQSPTPWTMAKVDCEDISGRMFSDVDGTAKQIEFLDIQFGHKRCIWLGIHRINLFSSQWVTTEGQVVPNNLLFWDPTSPEPSYGLDLYIMIYRFGENLLYIHDVATGEQCSVLCDMKES